MTKDIQKPKKNIIQRPLTKARKEIFLNELKRHGIAAEAARVASPHSTERHGCLSTFRSEKARDPVFAADWLAAQEEADARLMMEAHRRAVEGCEKGIFQKGQRVMDHDGQPATEKQYSDRLMELLLRARFPSQFIERRAIEHSGQVDHSVRGLLITGTDLLALGTADRENLSVILQKIADHRGEFPAPLEPPMNQIQEAEFEEETPR